jgi:hypothetical protein
MSLEPMTSLKQRAMGIMRMLLTAAFLLALAPNAYAAAVPQPIFTPNDSWSYHVSVQKNGRQSDLHVTVSVMRIGSDSVVVTEKTDVNPDRVQSMMLGLDWSRRRSVNGQEITVNQPFSFPLDVGKTWRLEYTEQNPSPQKLRETDTLPYKVVGWEEVTVPAGKFRALKIESDGRWTADVPPRVLNGALVARQGSVVSQTTESRVVQGVRVSGRYYKCSWYVPEVKRWVKSTEENYNSNGSLNEVVMDELESFDVGGAPKPQDSPTVQPTIPSPSKDGI